MIDYISANPLLCSLWIFIIFVMIPVGAVALCIIMKIFRDLFYSVERRRRLK